MFVDMESNIMSMSGGKIVIIIYLFFSKMKLNITITVSDVAF